MHSLFAFRWMIVIGEMSERFGEYCGRNTEVESFYSNEYLFWYRLISNGAESI